MRLGEIQPHVLGPQLGILRAEVLLKQGIQQVAFKALLRFADRFGARHFHRADQGALFNHHAVEGIQFTGRPDQ